MGGDRGRFYCLLLLALESDEEARAACYREAIDAIHSVVADPAHPLEKATLALGTDAASLAGEVAVKTAGASGWKRRIHSWRKQLETKIGELAMSRDWKIDGVQWGKYKNEVIANTDHHKFDDGLRMVLVADEEQAASLRRTCENLRRSGRVVFGLHDSEHALLTCLIFDRPAGNHLHFVDGAEGGYSLASKELKQQLLKSLL